MKVIAKKTWEQIIAYVSATQGRIGKDTKLNEAIKKLSKQLMAIQTKREEKKKDDIEDRRIDLCSVDASGNIIRDANNNKTFTKDAEKKLRDALKAIDKKLEAEEYDIETVFCAEMPSDMTEDEKEVYKGFIELTPSNEPAGIMPSNEPAGSSN